MSGLKLLFLILAILTFLIMMILGLFIPSAGLTLAQWFGVLGIGSALFAASFLPIP